MTNTPSGAITTGPAPAERSTLRSRASLRHQTLTAVAQYALSSATMTAAAAAAAVTIAMAAPASARAQGSDQPKPAQQPTHEHHQGSQAGQNSQSMAGMPGMSGMAAQSDTGGAWRPVTASDSAAVARARADSMRHPYTDADIRFMSGMIAHHAQAIVMARWAPTHGASQTVQTLCARIINAQQDEIRTMQGWLRDRMLPVPEARPMPMKMVMNGQEHMMLMPGMLTDEQMHQLDAARGPEFDQLFLKFMIQHHTGAVSMVRDLFATNGAAQDELVFKLANDIQVDQKTEIKRMQRMLVDATLGSDEPGAQ
ncbi:MAG TPA: DUF305 domain-containing protein [Gemmatimonadaceae bacterium]|nr:DUF305 domain-containing protein [Gemmatimonadaceae bacterium]